jgi:hypothetical protein
MWVAGDLVMIGALLLTAAAWQRNEAARTRAAERTT